MSERSIYYQVLILCFSPIVSLSILALKAWFHKPFGEKSTSFIAASTFVVMSTLCFMLVVSMIACGCAELRVPIGSWFSLGHYHFRWVLLVDKLSLSMATVSNVLLSLVGVFSFRYLHRESGFYRFYFFLLLFAFSFQLVVMAGNLDLVYFGWEIVGICSCMLIAFFHTRTTPVQNGFRAFITYRLCDIGILAAIVWCHHIGGGSFFSMAAHGSHLWPGLQVPAITADLHIVGLLIVWASLGKAAQIPFSGWLPRAMEGPTPSSAIFYGALSIHLGPFLLLRMWPLIEQSRLLCMVISIVGLLTALHATFVGHVQSDIKSVLAYASMTQVALIFIEIGFGFTTFALIHMIGHALLRSLQILRSPNLLYDYHNLEQAIGKVMPRTGVHLEKLIPQKAQVWLYRLALERGYLDNFLIDLLLFKWNKAVLWCVSVENAWLVFIGEKQKASAALIEES